MTAQQVGRLNLAGLDRVLIAVATGEKRILLRQYAIRLKRSGTKVPRASLAEMGPRLDLALRRCKPAPPDLEAEALKQPAGLKKKKARLLRSPLRRRRRMHHRCRPTPPPPPPHAAAAVPSAVHWGWEEAHRQGKAPPRPRGDDHSIKCFSDTSCARARHTAR
jgi:hypothetical protein